MGTTADKLAYLNQTKETLKSNLIKKEMSVPAGTTFRKMAELVGDIDTGSKVPLEAVTNLVATAGNAKVSLTWTDPVDKTATPGGEVVAVWAYTRIIRKVGSAPAGPNDGVIVVESGVRNQYKSTPYVDTGVSNDTTYFYAAYAYTDRGIVSEGVNTEGVTPKSFDPVLNNNSWEQIKAASDADIAESLWAVGDCKEIEVNGLVGTEQINGTYCVYILGFNHNESVEGKGITFGTFKTSLSGGIDVCLVDSHYDGASTGGQKWFNMNHSSGINSGGWKGCDLRYDVLGSTNVNKGDATSNCATSPVSGTLMAALPSGLRDVMKPMNIYTDNTGGGNDIPTYVTKTVDYLPFLAEFEIFGIRKYANSAEQNYQQQYQYYKNGNSKVKYRHSSTSSYAFWWERSPFYFDSHAFCNVQRYGNSDASYANRPYGLSPVFRV